MVAGEVISKFASGILLEISCHWTFGFCEFSSRAAWLCRCGMMKCKWACPCVDAWVWPHMVIQTYSMASHVMSWRVSAAGRVGLLHIVSTCISTHWAINTVYLLLCCTCICRLCFPVRSTVCSWFQFDWLGAGVVGGGQVGCWVWLVGLGMDAVWVYYC